RAVSSGDMTRRHFATECCGVAPQRRAGYGLGAVALRGGGAPAGWSSGSAFSGAGVWFDLL
ncbi:hypothetical protein, partial [Streptomyces klenkii]|uniref:hypothetical protein n=1 Tax=Streptomyces klenkii TaxID=1420899 RepID=UPI003417B90B